MKSSIILLLLCACALSGAAAAPSLGSASIATGGSCAAVKSRAPCGQVTDGESRCLLKGCCYDGSDAVNPCFFGGGDAVPITEVHVIQACHFDAGYAGFTTQILTLWWYTHFPQARLIGQELEALGGAEGLHFMAQSWIVSLFLDCPPGVPGLACPSAAQIANLTDSIQRGWVTWHAYPFNAELELGDATLVELGLNLTWSLDDRFGLPRKATLSQRDVPGTTRGVVPLFSRLGVRAMTEGVNGFSTAPAVPRAFVWRDEASGATLPTMVHPGGYGGIGYEDVVIVPGLAAAVVWDWRGDNAGPPASVAEVVQTWANLSAIFPGASIFASTLDNFTGLLTPAVLAALPVVTAEIGDTWTYGAAADPQKSAWNALARTAVRECVAAGTCGPLAEDAAFANASRFILKQIEHTWGHDTKSLPGDYIAWDNAALERKLAANDSHFFGAQQSWIEQRSYGVDYALQALAGHPLGRTLAGAFGSVYPAPGGPLAGPVAWTPAAPGDLYSVGRFNISFDPASGAIAQLVDAATGAVFAGAGRGGVLALPEYHSYSSADYDAFAQEYSYVWPPPACCLLQDFTRPNMTANADALHVETPAALLSFWTARNASAATTSFLAQLAFGDNVDASGPHAYYGAPQVAFLLYTLADEGGDTINVTFSIFNKTRTRLPEALYLRFRGAGGGQPNLSTGWLVDKLGSWVDPTDVVVGGGHRQHGVGSGGLAFSVTQGAAKGSLTLTAADAQLAAFGHPFALPTPTNVTVDATEGVAWMLQGNLWGTNYPEWLPFVSGDENQQWHFTMAFGA